jgi:DeoR/GlpR family transcriptional regulator of sugar metabolism
MQNSETRILVADHTKSGRYAPVVTGTLGDVDILVMNFISESIKQFCATFEVGFSKELLSC